MPGDKPKDLYSEVAKLVIASASYTVCHLTATHMHACTYVRAHTHTGR